MSSNKPLALSGCWTAMVTPFTSDATRVDVECFKRQIRAQAEGALLLAGGAAEVWIVTEADADARSGSLTVTLAE